MLFAAVLRDLLVNIQLCVPPLAEMCSLDISDPEYVGKIACAGVQKEQEEMALLKIFKVDVRPDVSLRVAAL